MRCHPSDRACGHSGDRLTPNREPLRVYRAELVTTHPWTSFFFQLQWRGPEAYVAQKVKGRARSTLQSAQSQTESVHVPSRIRPG